MRRVAILVLALSLGVTRSTGASSDGAAFVAAVRADAAATFDDAATANREGYRPSNVVGTIEHWVDDDYVDDGRTLDPARPEGLVYRVDEGRRTLVAVFFFVDDGVGVPAVGGAGWHTHPTCSGLAGIGTPVPGGPCPVGTSRRAGPSMLHVWVGSGATGWSPFEPTVAPAYVCRLPV